MMKEPLEAVIMMDPDGSYDENMAHVVYHNKEEKITLQCFEGLDTECELVKTFDEILKDTTKHTCGAIVKDDTCSYEVFFTNIGTYAKKL